MTLHKNIQCELVKGAWERNCPACRESKQDISNVELSWHLFMTYHLCI